MMQRKLVQQNNIATLFQKQFASVFFCTEIAVAIHFDAPKCDFWRGLVGPQKIF